MLSSNNIAEQLNSSMTKAREIIASLPHIAIGQGKHRIIRVEESVFAEWLDGHREQPKHERVTPFPIDTRKQFHEERRKRENNG